jgi:hypothetical protein
MHLTTAKSLLLVTAALPLDIKKGYAKNGGMVRNKSGLIGRYKVRARISNLIMYNLIKFPSHFCLAKFPGLARAMGLHLYKT